MKKLFLCALVCINLSFAVFATPKEVFIVRHADKLEQPDPGPALSPKGLIRSIMFAFYFVNKFGEPDVIFASDPSDDEVGNSSIRELQTVAPLANLLSARRTIAFPIAHPYMNSEFAELAKDLKQNSKFKDKRVLICWNHNEIPQLAKALGVLQAPSTWPESEFDNVYVIKYNSDGTVKSFAILKQQYGVTFDGSWRDLYESFITDET